MQLRTTLVNETEGRMFSEWAEELDEEMTRGELYRALQDEWGRCTGKVYVDGPDDCRPLRPRDIPADFEVRPVMVAGRKGIATCGNCGLSWDDEIITGLTPAPSARCPFEYFHCYGGPIAVGWCFESRQRYEDTGEEYLRGAWCVLEADPEPVRRPAAVALDRLAA